ncbi:glycosyltransferase family 39 protein [Myxococcota bacterium]|nr:glycosyltransferase family 39 protein [Myxococcota bacterium]
MAGTSPAQLPRPDATAPDPVPSWAYAVLVALLVVVAVGQNAWLVRGQDVLPLYDGHYPRAVNFHRFLLTLDPTFLQRHGEPVFSNLAGHPGRYPLYGAYPPLVYLWTALAFTLGGVSVEVARLAVVAFGLVLLPSLAGIGRQLGGRLGGLAVLSLAVASPVPWFTSRMYLLDYPQAAMTAAALWALVASDGFRRRGPSLAVGVLLALSMLTKWSTGYYVVVPLAWAALAAPGRQPRAWRLWALGAAQVAWVVGAGAVSLRMCSRPDQWVSQGWWLLAWGLGIVAPSAVAVAVVLRGERRWRGEPGWASSPARRVVHLVLAGSTCLVLAGPWYAWALGDLRHNLVVNTRHFASPGLVPSLSLAWAYLVQSLPLAGILLPVGAAFALLDRRARSLRPFVLSAGVVLVLLLHTGDPANFLRLDIQNRLSTGLVVFFAPVAGAWLGLVGRAAWAPVAAAMGLALFLVTGWIHSPGAAARWVPLLGAPVGELFAPGQPPQAAREQRAPQALISMLARLRSPDRPWSHAYFIASRTLPVELEINDLYARALVEADVVLAFDRHSPGVDRGDYRPMLAQQVDRLDELHALVLVSSPGLDGGRSLLAQVQAAGFPQAALREQARIADGLEAFAVTLRP